MTFKPKKHGQPKLGIFDHEDPIKGAKETGKRLREKLLGIIHSFLAKRKHRPDDCYIEEMAKENGNKD